MRPWHVAFEGPIAAGKTTLARRFAEVSGARPVLEEFAANEFLADFYGNEERWALPMQLGFLLARHRQFSASIDGDTPIVADHTYSKDLMFARILLTDRELRLYESIHRALRPPERIPNLIVYLDAPDEILLGRIGLRNRPYEAAITAAYLGQLREAYRRELLGRTDVRILKEDTGALDLKSETNMATFFDRILGSIHGEAT